MAKVTALIPCAGQGKRMGGAVNKPFLEVYDRPLLAYTLDKFQSHSLIDEVILIARSDEIEFCEREIAEKYGFTKVRRVVAGGLARQDSVRAGLAAVDEKSEWIVVHDGVRPLVSPDTITLVLKAAQADGAAVVGVPVKDTLKMVGDDFYVRQTPDRAVFWQVQTPQVFERHLLCDAYRQAYAQGWQGTDDASFVEMLGVKVRMVRGEYANIKVTTPEDLLLVKALIKVGK